MSDISDLKENSLEEERRATQAIVFLTNILQIQLLSKTTLYSPMRHLFETAETTVFLVSPILRSAIIVFVKIQRVNKTDYYGEEKIRLVVTQRNTSFE